MKTPIFLILAILVISSSLYSQTEKGAVVVGGFIGYQKTTDEDILATNLYKTTSERLSVSPYAGYFITENLLIGTGLDYSYYHNDFFFQSYESTELTDKIFFNSTFSEILLAIQRYV